MVALTTKTSLLASCCLVLGIGVYFHRDADPFDYFYLSLQWPPSLCNTGGNNSCSRVPDYFTIHGLWAQKKNRPYNCPNTFNYAKLIKINELMVIMNRSWPSLVVREPDPNIDFWRHEWEKHGSCTFKSNQIEYFNKTCGMWKQAKLLEFFNESGITPGNGASYRYLLKEYKEAIAKKLELEKPARFECNNDAEGNEQLLELKLCTNKEVNKFVECPENPKSLSAPRSHACPDSIKIAFPKVDAVAVM